MDAMDSTQLIQLSDTRKEERRMVLLNIKTGVPVATTIKGLFGKGVPSKGVIVESKKKKITAEQQKLLDDAWAKRVHYKRCLDDCSPGELQKYKKKYFAAIDDWKRLYSQIYGD